MALLQSAAFSSSSSAAAFALLTTSSTDLFRSHKLHIPISSSYANSVPFFAKSTISSSSSSSFTELSPNKFFNGASDQAKWRTEVSFFPSFFTKGKDVKGLKEELLEAIAPLDRGAAATTEDQERVDQIVRKLEAANEIKEPLKSNLLNGKWELLYTTSASILQTQRPKFLRPNGKIYQAINADTLRAQNMETWPLFNQVSTFIYNHGHALKMLREKCGGDLVRPCITRFATNYIALKSFEAKKPGLRAMFASTEWFAWRGSDTPAGRAARETINSEGFWQDVKKVVTLLEPLVKVLRMVDSEKKPTLPHLYAAIDMMKRHVHAAIPRGGKRYHEIIQTRWEKMLMHPMHKAAYYLNPKYQYKCKLGLIQELVDVVQVVEKLEPNSRMQSKCNQEATANLVPLNSRRVAVKFDSFKIASLIPIKARGSGRGQLEITYLDEELRISRGNQGNLFILKMADPSYRVPT